MITSRLIRDGVLQDEGPFDPADVERCRTNDADRIWVDVVDPTDEDLSLLQRTFRLHELSIEDSRRWGQRSKVEFYPDYVFLVAHGISIDDAGDLADSELHVFAGERFYLVTIRRSPRLEFRRALERIRRGSSLASEGIAYQLYLILDEVVDDYLDVVDALEDRADDVEERVFGDDDSRELQATLFAMKRRVIAFRRAVAPMREVLDQLTEQGGLVTQPLEPYYRDVQDHVIRTIELIDNIGELLRSSLEVRLVQASNRLNVVMKQLTAWAAIILIPTLIAGIYGMNFEHMPELGWRFGYPFALALMLVSAFVLYRMFRRRDWL